MMACEASGMLDELLDRPAWDMWLYGSDGNTDDDDTGRDDDEDADEDDEDEDEDNSDDDSKSKKSKNAWKRPSDSDIKAMQRRISNFDEERDRDKAKIKKLGEEKSDLSKEITRLTAEGVKDEDVKKANAELTSENSKLQATVSDLQIQIAFLGDTTRQWANPSRAVKLLDRSNIEIDDKGRVTGLKTAIDELAESDPYLLVQPKDSDDDGDDTDADKGTKQQRKTGEQPTQRRSSGGRGQQARDEKLRQRFSGLRGR